MIAGSCHCGNVQIAVASAPEWVAMCNCSLCRRTGVLMAYYPADALTVTGETAPYLTGDKWIAIHHCPICACLTHWEPVPDIADRGLSAEDLASLTNRRGVNARLLDGFVDRRAQPVRGTGEHDAPSAGRAG
jgi:hypothetical protein